MSSLRWTPQALEDVASIRDFIARDTPGYANVVVDRIFESVERLRDYPQSGRVVPEFEHRGAWFGTFDFHARAFYERLGYAVFGELADFPAGHTYCERRKVFAAPAPPRGG